jgi:hypothetical protein
MTLAAEQRRLSIDRPFLCIPFLRAAPPPFGGSFEEGDCATSMVMTGRTDEIVHIATTTVPC